jgi:putative glycosyltransferase (TIGR04372 family)
MKLLHRLVNWLNDRGPYVFLTPCISVIGNCSEELQFGLLRARREGKRLVVLYPFDLPWKFRFPLTNSEVFRIASPYRADVPAPLFFLLRAALTAIYGPMRALSLVAGKLFGPSAHLAGWVTHPALGSTTLWKPEEEPAEFRWDVVDRYHWTEEIPKPLNARLAPEKRARAHALRLEMGIPEGAWFVGLHVRQRGFYNPKEEATCRNATVADFIPAIKEITSRGGWVVRLGDKSMTPLPPLERVVDYPHTRFKSDLMDMYLLSESRFYVGMTSGILDTSYMFQKPMILTNMTTWSFAYPRRPGDLGITKHLFSKKLGRYLSLRELLETPWEAQHFHHFGEEYDMRDNTPEEIRDVVAEFLENDGQPKPNELQLEFNRRRIEHGRRLLDKPIWPNDHYTDMHQRYRLASRLESSSGFMGAKFLAANWERDALETGAAKAS